MAKAGGAGLIYGKHINMPAWVKGACLTLLMWLVANLLHATHGLAGSITYRSLGNNQYEVTLTTFTNPCAASVDRCFATIEVWGLVTVNGVTSYVRVDAPELVNLPRVNGSTTLGAPFNACPGTPGGEVLRKPTASFCVKKNIYRGIITLRGGGCFEFRYSDYARINGVVNMANSGDISWFCRTQLCNNPFTGGDDSPVLLNDPVDDACVGKVWSYNPAGFDVNGDSLSFSIKCSENYDGSRILNPICAPGYVFPDSIIPGANNRFRVNPITGVVTWNAPQLAGVYNFALVISSYRGGGFIGSITRDIAIIVQACTNDPPILSVGPDVCVTAGQTVQFLARARDPNPGDSLYFYNTNTGIPSAPFSPSFFPLATDRATLIPPNDITRRPQLIALQPQAPNPPDPNFFPIATQFSWTPKCNALSATPWRVDFYVHDNLNRAVPSPSIVNGPPLAANAAVAITVSAPGLSNVTTQLAANRSVTLNWNTTGVCTGFIGFEIYRSIDSLNQAPNTCCTDDPTLGGYTRIATVGAGVRTFTDGPNLPFRGKYCYRIVTVYQPRGIGTELVRSCASRQSCITLNRDTPIILNADVTQTDAAAGAIFVRWRQPNFASFNPVFFPPPYRYRLEIANGVGGTAFTQVAGANGIPDSVFTVNGLNTVVRGYTFRVSVLDNNNQIAATSDPVSSIFLQTIPQNRAIQIRWSVQAGFINDTYTLFRAPAIGGPFTQLTTVNVTNITQQNFTFTDGGRPRGVQFCYFVRASGSYRNAQVHTAPLINNSNRSCTAATDTIPPCIPPNNAFRNAVNCTDFSVTFNWNAPPDSCGGGIAFYNVYRKRFPNDPPVRIAQVPRNTPQVSFRFVDPQTLSPVGCYSFEAVDTVGNISRRSTDFCVGDECPQFQLPNAFTPNGDSQNDVFTPITRDPFSVRGVRSVDTQIFDRAGRLVATSRDKINLWDGTIGGAPAPAGTYFYNIEITFESLNPTERIVRTGTVTLIR